MNENTTEIIFLLDSSASMRKLAEDTLGGYNAFLDACDAQRNI